MTNIRICWGEGSSVKAHYRSEFQSTDASHQHRSWMAGIQEKWLTRMLRPRG
jgi:hypothetical protein